MEKIRRLAQLLQSGIEEYDAAVKTLESERLKYLRLSMTNGFGTADGESKMSWLTHLQSLETTLHARVNALRQAVVNAAVDIQSNLRPAQPDAPSGTEPPLADPDDEETESLADEDKV